MTKPISHILAVLITLQVTLDVSQASAALWYGDGYWSDSTKWSNPGGPPTGPGSIADIRGGTAWITGSADVDELLISPVPAPQAGVEISHAGIAGRLTTQRTYIGYFSNTSGTANVTIDGNNSTGGIATWSNAGDLIVGYRNSIAWNTLDVRSGARVTSGRAILGDFATVIGNATVDGSSSNGYSIWDSGSELRVGNFGVGTLNISNQGHVIDNTSYVGVWGSSTGTVNVTGSLSLWETRTDLIIGYQSTATNRLIITDHGDVLSNRGIIGDYGPAAGTPSAVGDVTVDNSTWNLGPELLVGNAGIGTLRIQNGGLVQNNIGRIGVLAGSNGTVSVSGASSNWIMTGDLNIGHGSLSLDSGVVTAPAGVTIETGGDLSGRGTITANSVVNNGNVHLTSPFAALSLSGSYTQTSSSTLTTNLDGDGISKLAVNGNITLAGALNVTNLDFPFWEPEIGQSYDILDWVGGASGISGTFASITLPAIHGAKMWNKSRLYTTGVISVSSPGDFSDDGLVDAGDYIAWRRSGGSAAEYNMWRANFGFGGPGSGSAALASSMSRSVPEPSSSTLLIVATTLVACGRRSRRQHITGSLPPLLRRRRGVTLRRAAVGRRS